MKKTIKILTILLLVAMIVISSTSVFAKQSATSVVDDIKKSVNGTETKNGMSEVSATVGKIVAYLRNASILIGVVIIVILGIKYMMGSVEQKADYQKSFVPLIVGIVVVMAATSIASFLFSLFD